MEENGILTLVRRFIYSRRFYAFLVLVCLINVIAEILDIADPGENFTLDLISLVVSLIAALLAGAVFLDLHFRRAKR